MSVSLVISVMFFLVFFYCHPWTLQGGCITKLEQFLADHLLVIGAVGIGVACLQVSKIRYRVLYVNYTPSRTQTQSCGCRRHVVVFSQTAFLSSLRKHAQLVPCSRRSTWTTNGRVHDVHTAFPAPSE